MSEDWKNIYAKPKEITDQNLTSYGELITANAIPIIAADAVYNFIPSNFRSFTSLSGATGITSNGMFYAECGTTSLGYAAIQSFRSINHKIGQSAEIVFAAYFDDAAALTWQGVGGFNIGDEMSFGLNGLEFGVWHRYGGFAHVSNLNLTVGAGGAETVTLTLNSVAYNIPVTVGTVQHNAREIAEWLTSNADVWNAEQNNDDVIISATSDGAKDGTYSISSTGTLAGTISTTKSGVTKTSDFKPMSEWNGTIPDEFDYTKGNSYRIQYQNGFGNIHYFIEDHNSGQWVRVHTVKNLNEKTNTNLTNPSVRCGMYAASIGGTTNVSPKVAHISGKIYGQVQPIRNPRSVKNSKSISTTLTNILTIRNKRVFNGRINQVEIEPLAITLANTGTKTAEFQIRTNCSVAGDINYEDAGNNLVSEIDVSGTTASEDGILIDAYEVTPNNSESITLTDFNIRIPPTLRITISAKQLAGGSAGDLSAKLTYYEDIA